MSAAKVLSALRDCLQSHSLLRPDARLLAAVSGGSDSMALLAALQYLQQEMTAASRLHIREPFLSAFL